MLGEAAAGFVDLQVAQCGAQDWHVDAQSFARLPTAVEHLVSWHAFLRRLMICPAGHPKPGAPLLGSAPACRLHYPHCRHHRLSTPSLHQTNRRITAKYPARSSSPTQPSDLGRPPHTIPIACVLDPAAPFNPASVPSRAPYRFSPCVNSRDDTEPSRFRARPLRAVPE